ncbi:MAG: hypothetical protein AB7V26_05485 [Lysobacterales bacterium]
MVILMVLGGLLVAFLCWSGLRFWRQHRRIALLRQVLDDVDQIEVRLNECRERMHGLDGMLERLPADITTRARSSLDSEADFQTARRLVLQHRLWLRDHSASASLATLDEVAASVRKSLLQLDQQLQRLDGVGKDLAAAYARSDALIGPVPGGPDGKLRQTQ